MKLIDRQIKVVEKGLERVKKEKDIHRWSRRRCALCKAFCDCEGCPLTLFHNGTRLTSCFNFAVKQNYATEIENSPAIPVEDLAGFLQSLLISLRLMK